MSKSKYDSVRAVSENPGDRFKYNYQSMMEYEEMKKDDWKKKILDRQQKAAATAQNKIKEVKEEAAKRNKKQQEFVMTLQSKKYFVCFAYFIKS